MALRTHYRTIVGRTQNLPLARLPFFIGSPPTPRFSFLFCLPSFFVCHSPLTSLLLHLRSSALVPSVSCLLAFLFPGALFCGATWTGKGKEKRVNCQTIVMVVVVLVLPHFRGNAIL